MVASTLRRGEAAIVGYNTGQTDGNGTTIDSMEFVILAPIGSGTVIRFTDRQWNGTAFVNAANDGSFAFTAGADLAAGTVIGATFSGGNVVFTVNGVASAPISAGGFNPEEAGDAIYVYQGTDANTPTGFLSATEIGDGNTTFNGSLVNTGLVNGVTAVSTALDSATYHGPTTDAFAHFYNNERLLENIMDSTNWVGDDADGQKALDQPNHNGPYNLAPNLSLWTAGQGGGNGIVHVGADPAVSSGQFGYNLTQLYTNHPTLVGARDVAFDTVEGKFFVAEGERILQGNISDLLGNPSSQVAMTVLYTGVKPDNVPTLFGDNNIFNLEVDTANNIIYFSHGSQISKIGYNTAGQTATVLADFNVGNPVSGSNRNHVDDFVIHFASGTIYATSHRITSGQDGDQLTKNYIYKITGLDAGDGANAFTFANGAITFLPFSPDDDDATNGFTWAGGEAFPQEEGTLEGVAISADGNTLYFTAATTLYDHDADGGFSGPGGFGTPPLLVMGGVFSYALTGNPTGVYTQIWQQLDDGDTNSQAISHTFGPQGLLDDIEFDPVTGHLYFLDQTGDQLGTVNPPGDEGIWRIATNGTGLTYFANINNISAMGPSSIWLNHAPTVNSSTQATPGVTEASSAPSSGNTALVQPFTALDVTDHETAGNPTQQLAGATVWISNNFQSGATHQDVLTINGLTSGSVNGVNFNYNSATGAMTLSGVDTFNDYEAAIALVRFNTSGDDVTAYGAATNRTISWAVSDGLNHSDPVSTTISVTGINDAPVNTAGAAMNFSEDTTGNAGGTPPVNAVTGISVFDVDADPATQDIVVTLSVNVGTLDIRTDVTGGLAAGEVTGNGTATLTLTGTQNQINATLAAVNGTAQPNGLVYSPPANFNGAANLTITTNDNGFNGNDPGNSGTGLTEQDQDVKVLNVADVNDAPTVSGSGAEVLTAIKEDLPTATAGAASSIADIFADQFSDATDVQVSGGNPTGSTGDDFAGVVVVGNGSSGTTGEWQYWNGSNWIDIGTVSESNARILVVAAKIRFEPVQDYNGPAPTLTVRLVEDSASTFTNGAMLNVTAEGTGGTSRISSGLVTLDQDVTAVNDAPVNTLPLASLDINEDAGAVALTGMSVADVEATGDITYVLGVEHGVLNILTNVPGGIEASDIQVIPGTGNGTSSMTIVATAAQINTTLAAANGLTYTADADYNGSDTLAVYVNDNGQTGEDLDPASVLDPGVGATSQEDYDEREINIAAVADIDDDSDTINEDAGASSIMVLANDSFEGTPAITAFDQGSNGTVTLHDNNTSGDTSDDYLVYTPNADYHGSDSFTYTVTSGGVTETATVSVTVSPVADIEADSPTTDEDTAVNIMILLNDTWEGTPEITAETDGTNGTVSIHDAGTPGDTTDDYLVYTPNADFNGSDTIGYTITSGGATETGSINVTVTAVADAVDDDVNVAQDSSANVVPVLANDSFEDSGAIIQSVGLATNGTAAVDDAGTPGDSSDDFVTYTPTAGYSGPDSFTYTILSGGVTETATVNVDVIAPNVRPVVDLDGGDASFDYSTSYPENDPPIAIGASIGVSDADGDDIEGATIALSDPVAGDLLSLSGALPTGITVDPGSTDDVLVLTGTASAADYAAALALVQFSSSSDDPTDGGLAPTRTIGVTVSDAGGAGTPASSVITINASDDPAVARDDAFTTDEATPFSCDLFADNGSGVDDPDGPQPVIVAVSDGGTVGSQFTLPSGALLTVNSDGTFDYDPNGAFDSTPDAATGAANTPATDSFTYTLAAGGTATVTFTIIGLDSNDTITGTPGADDLTGDGGLDSFYGLGGDDDYHVNSSNDLVFETIGNGFDRIFTTANYVLGPNASIEVLQTEDPGGSDPLSLTGNYLAQTLIGNEGNNVLHGGGGLDTLSGLGGNDVYYTDNAGVQIVEVGGGGNDALYTSTSYVLGGNASVELLSTNSWAGTSPISLTGNYMAQTLIGNAGNNMLHGGGGADILIGLGGDDVYYTDFPIVQIVEAANGGFDSLFTSVSYALSEEVHIELLSTNSHAATSAINLTGNHLDNILVGNAGNNVLHGGGGNDTLHGLGGNDTYYVDVATVQVFEDTVGFDTIYSSVSYTLGVNSQVEVLSTNNHVGTTAIDLTGNRFASTLVGNDGDNVLDGKAGKDVLLGREGADTFAFTTALGAGNVDQLPDFVAGLDRIALDDAIFTGLATGTLDSAAFHIGSSAADEGDRIIYNSTTGALFFDADGAGGAAQVQFAWLNPGLSLQASDFQVI